MEPSLLVYRSSLSHLFAAIICLVILLAWAASGAGLIEGGGLMPSRYFSAFVILFVVPVGVYMSFLAIQRTPVLALSKDELSLSNSVFPWRKVVLHRADIESVATSYSPESTKCSLVIVLSQDARPDLSTSKLWLMRRDRTCHFGLLNTTILPPQAEAAVTKWLHASAK